ncbi:MAG: hypothetical protein ACRD26_23775 [Vicinamibacterales bacterium]
MPSALEPSTVDAGGSPPQKDFWDKLKILMPVAVIPLLGVLLPFGVSYREQLVAERDAAAQRANEQRQIEAQAHEVERQRKISEAQLASVLLPVITGGSQEARRSALEVLTSVSPELAERLAQGLMTRAATPADRAFANRLAVTSRQAAQMAEFTRLLALARNYREVPLYAECARAFFNASNVAPGDMKEHLAPAVTRARGLYDSNDFRGACLVLEAALAEAAGT